MAEKKKLTKKIEFDFEGTHYVLEYTRRTLVKLARDLKQEGVDLKELMTKGLSEDDSLLAYMILEMMFDASFYAHHPNVSRETKENLFERISDKEKLGAKLFEIAAAPIETLTDEEEQGEITWTAGE
jgi:hypothetical protein